MKYCYFFIIIFRAFISNGAVNNGTLPADYFYITRDYVMVSTTGYSESHVTRSTRECAAICGQSEDCLAVNVVPTLSSTRQYSCSVLSAVNTSGLVATSGSYLLVRKVDHCDPNPCENGGTCTSGLSSYTCTCPAHCTGVTCATCCVIDTFHGSVGTASVESPTGDFPRKDIEVYVEEDTAGYDWIVLMRRQDGSQDFVNQNWTEYKEGFGNSSAEFWIGNDNMYYLTNNGSTTTLRIDMKSFGGDCGYAEYSMFNIASEADKYRLTISGYSGDLGDSMMYYPSNYHSGQRFSTSDSDNDNSAGHCAKNDGGWWYNNCFNNKLTGEYGPSPGFSKGIHWFTWLGALKTPSYVDMKIRAN